jgi:hypothetical protein
MTIAAILALALVALATGALKPSEGNPNPLIEAEEAKSISARRGHYKKTRSGINNMSAAQRPHGRSGVSEHHSPSIQIRGVLVLGVWPT